MVGDDADSSFSCSTPTSLNEGRGQGRGGELLMLAFAGVVLAVILVVSRSGVDFVGFGVDLHSSLCLVAVNVAMRQ